MLVGGEVVVLLEDVEGGFDYAFDGTVLVQFLLGLGEGGALVGGLGFLRGVVGGERFCAGLVVEVVGRGKGGGLFGEFC